VPSPNHICCLVEREWKYAVYYDAYTGKDPQYEMYHRPTDPLERRNLAHPAVEPPAELKATLAEERLHRRLTRVMEQLGTTPEDVVWPRVSGSTELVRTNEPDPVIDPVRYTTD